MDRPHILLLTDHPAQSEDVARPLENAGYSVRRQALASEVAPEEKRPHLLVFDGGGTDLMSLFRRWRGGVPRLVILGDAAPSIRLACVEAGADAYLLRPFASREIVSLVRSLVERSQLQGRLTAKTAEAQAAHVKLRNTFQRGEQDVEAARRLQISALPRQLPEVPGLRLAVHQRTCGRTGGDLYDAFRLDEFHTGFYLADAMGRGVSAALLALFLKLKLATKDMDGSNFHLVSPDEALQRINRELLELVLPEGPFLSMLYVQVNSRDGSLKCARAGHPPPLYVPREGPAEFWPSFGGLLGVLPTEIALQTKQLGTGDKLLLYSDGLVQTETERERLLITALEQRALPIREYVERTALALIDQSNPRDDATLFGLEMGIR